MAKLVSKTYGEALFELAVEEGKEDEFLAEVVALKEILDENPDFNKLMNHPKILKDEKLAVLNEVFSGRISEELKGFLHLVVSKDRYSEIDAILTYFVDEVKRLKGIGVAYVSTAITLNEAKKEEIKQRLLATTTYNGDIFPYMRQFMDAITERNYSNRTVAFIENGSWAPMAYKVMRGMLEKSKNITYTENNVKIMSALNEESLAQLDLMARELCKDYLARSSDTANKNDLTALFKIGYGLYVVTSNDGKKDNGLIVNTVTQVTNSPNRIAVTINKENYSHHVIKQTGKMNVNCLTTEAPFSVFEAFGFRSGRNTDKFENCEPLRSDNGLVFLPRYINSFMSLKVENYVDLGTHGMFICEVTEARVISDKDTMTYSYYHENVKPKPQTEGKKGWVCTICGYIHEDENLPDDFICPLCKHGANDFEPIK